jgi:hypothetical protein
MRWPFHFGKAARPEDEQAAPAPPPPPQRHDWASLAPIQRTIGDIPLTAPSVEFGQSLAGSEEPALSLEPLGHHRSPEGPQGIVAGIASPVESYSHSTELVVRPRRRAEVAAGVQATLEEAEGPATSDSVQTGGDDAAPGLLTRVLPAVSVEATRVPAPSNRLTDAGKVEVGPLRPVQRAPETPVPAEPGVAPVVDEPPPGPPPGTRLSLGLSRRHGLGAPIRGAEPAPLQRLIQPAFRADSPPTRTHSSPASPAASDPHTSVEVPISPASPPQQKHDDVRSGTADLEAALLPLPPARRQTGAGHSDDAGTAGMAETGPDTSPIAPPVPDADAPAARIAAPAAGEALSSLQRLAGPVGLKPAAPDPLRMPAPHRAAPTVPLTSARAPLTAVRHAGEPERVSVPGTQPHSTFGAALPPMALPAVSPSAPMSWGPAGTPASRPAPSPAHGPLIWNLQRMAAGDAPGEEPITNEQPPTAGAGPSAGAPTMAAAAALVPSAGSAPTTGNVAGETAPRPGEAATGAPAPGAAPVAHGEKELDELAHVLFPRLMSLVRFDLLIERERAGLVTDLR